MNGYTYIVAAVVLTAACALICVWRRGGLWLKISSKPPPVIDSDGENVKARLDRAREQQDAASQDLRNASDELIKIVGQVLADNDRLRSQQHYRGGRRA